MNIEEIRAREQAATPGEWVTPPTFSGICSQNGDILAINRIVNTRDADMLFIAHARQDIPDLLSEIVRLTAELEKKNRELAQLAIESLNREKQLAKLEAETEAALSALEVE